MLDVLSSAHSSLPAGSNVVLFVAEKSKDPIGSFLFGSVARKALEQARGVGFEGKLDQVTLVHAGLRTVSRFIFVGLGNEKEISFDFIRRGTAAAVRRANALKLSKVFVRVPVLSDMSQSSQAATEGALLGAYRYTEFQSKPVPSALQTVSLLTKDASEAALVKSGVARGRVFAEAVNTVRDWVNCPPSDMDPATMTALAQKASRSGFKLRVYKKTELKKMSMGGILGVNRGSAKDPFFLHMLYRPKRGPVRRRIGICGKGITFDSGGLSLKPAKSMETMKDDMTGAATVINLMKALAILQPAVEVHGFTPITENMPGGDAVKPGDVLRTFRGKTIEVLNTDAEGRLVLSDALSFACRQKLDEVIDIATLTGACVVALGTKIAGLMGNNADLQSRLSGAASQAGEKLWPLPLDKEYEPMLKSHVADIKNIGVTGVAGTIIGGLFLKSFVDETMPWAHLDIASTAWSDEGTALSPPGATGFMVRTLLTYLTGRYS